MNHHIAFNMPDNQQSRRILIAAKASVRNIIFMKTIAFFIVVFHRDSLTRFFRIYLKCKIIQMD